jgi:CxxC motif-containing protein
MSKRELVCIVCPLGCALSAELAADGSIVSVSGNTCPRGAAYAKTELTHPTRTLTTTVRFSNRDGLLPVKTSCPISKGKLLQAAAALRDVRVEAPVHIGDVILAGLVGEADLVACADVE